MKHIESFLSQLEQTNDPYKINMLAEDLIKTKLSTEFASLWYFDEENFKLVRGRDTHQVNELSLHVKQGIIYKCFMTKQSELYNYLASNKDYIASIDNPDNIKIKSKIMIPLISGDTVVGIATAYNSIKNGKKFTKNDMRTFKSLMPYLLRAVAKIHNKPLLEEHLPSTIIPNYENSVEKQAPQQDESSKDETLTFVANFVHDIRTPANSLYGFLDLLEGQITDERLKSYIVNAKESAEFINELTTSVLNMISTHKESEVSEIEEVDAIKFFSTIAKSFSSNMYAKRIRFNIYIDPTLPKSIKIDTLKMKRVILNLIGNAYKFTPKNHTIEFSVKYVKKTQRIALYVKDTGIGIPPEKQEGIFEAFKQAEDTTALNFGGTGLGLFISAKYVKELGGTLALVSEVDKGSTFSFDIPAYITNNAPSYPPLEQPAFKIALIMGARNNFCANNLAKHIVRMGVKKEQIVALASFDEISDETTHIIVFQHKINTQALEDAIAKGKKILVVEEDFLSIDKDELCFECDVVSQYGFIAGKTYKFLQSQKEPRVLIVDDDLVSVMLIETILENEFCTTTLARNGKEALDVFMEAHKQNTPFDIVYIDNQMPFMNGNEVVRRIREYEKDNQLNPIFAISTSGERHGLKTDKEQYDMHIGKPFKKEQIREALMQPNLLTNL